MSWRVLLVDDHDLIRQGLSRAFERDVDFVVAGQASTLNEAQRKVDGLSPDVVVTDVRLPDGSGLDLIRRVRRERDDVGLVVLTMYAGDATLLEALDAGASAFLYKDAKSAEVVAAARYAVVSPMSFTAPDLAAVMQRSGGRSGKSSLSTRETEVLQLLSQGYDTAEVAQKLYISRSTAKTHIAKIYEKLGATNRAQAVMTAVHYGLITEAVDLYV